MNKQKFDKQAVGMLVFIIKTLLANDFSHFFTPETQFQILHQKTSDFSCLLTTAIFKLFLEFACLFLLLATLAFQFHLKLKNNEKNQQNLKLTIFVSRILAFLQLLEIFRSGFVKILDVSLTMFTLHFYKTQKTQQKRERKQSKTNFMKKAIILIRQRHNQGRFRSRREPTKSSERSQNASSFACSICTVEFCQIQFQLSSNNEKY